MVTAEMHSDSTQKVATELQSVSTCCTTPADQGLSLSAVGGAVIGASPVRSWEPSSAAHIPSCAARSAPCSAARQLPLGGTCLPRCGQLSLFEKESRLRSNRGERLLQRPVQDEVSERRTRPPRWVSSAPTPQACFEPHPSATADTRFDAPTPMMLDEMTWVVLTGAFNHVASKITSEAAVSAAKPLIGRNLMMRGGPSSS